MYETSSLRVQFFRDLSQYTKEKLKIQARKLDVFSLNVYKICFFFFD